MCYLSSLVRPREKSELDEIGWLKFKTEIIKSTDFCHCTT